MPAPDRDITPREPHPILRSARDREAIAHDAAEGAGHAMRALAHELTGLIDACLRSIVRARKVGDEHDDGVRAHLALGAADAYLRAAETAMHEAASLVQATMRTGRLTGPPSGRSLSARRAPAEILAHAAEVLFPLAEERAVRITTTIGPAARELPPLPIYPIVANALRNAVEASPDNADVRAHLHLESETPSRPPTLVLEITDEGPGPPEGDDDPFDPSFSTKERGTGLGLAIARDVANELGGTVALEPRDGTPGTPGARFTLRVPITKPVIG